MKYMILSVLVMVLVLMSSTGQFVSAHDGVAHATEAESTEHNELADTQMRTIIALLQKLVFLLQLKVEAQNTIPTYQTATEIPVHENAHDEEMESHHEMHTDEPKGVNIVIPEKKLIIEVEEHNSTTHVHVRNTDKPEEMFFVKAPLSDEGEIVRQITERTGLPEADVRAALVYTGM